MLYIGCTPATRINRNNLGANFETEWKLKITFVTFICSDLESLEKQSLEGARMGFTGET